MNRFFVPSRKLAAHRLAHGGPRIYDPRERWATALLDWIVRAGSGPLGLRPKLPFPDVRGTKRVLALRLDRLGDFLTTLPALQALRAALPRAEIELGVGSWNEPIARRLPFVDRVRIIDVPWAAWERKARFSAACRAVRGGRFDLALDFQGDLRVIFLMALSGARLRAGYADTGCGYLLTHRAAWDEKRSWYWQNLELVRTLLPRSEADVDGPVRPYNFVNDSDRAEAAEILKAKGLGSERRPLVGVQPSAGRAIKQWEEEKFAALLDRLSEAGRAVVVTGAAADAALVERILARTRSRPKTLLGLSLLPFAAVVERLDLFVTGDTGPMHLAHTVGTANVAIFGPSDPNRYGPDEGLGLRRVVRHPVYCSPCNMIRRPPRECASVRAPECIAGITVEEVIDAVDAALAARHS